MEVVVKHLRLSRKHRRRNVATHRANRVLAANSHRSEEELDVLLRVSERLLLIQQRLAVWRHGRHFFG